MRKNFCFFLLLLVVPGLSCHAFQNLNDSRGARYYIGPEGDDANPGTADLPWKTLEKANQTLQPGDMVTLRDEGIISPASSGKSRQEAISYRSENRHGAILTGQAGETLDQTFFDRKLPSKAGKQARMPKASK